MTTDAWYTLLNYEQKQVEGVMGIGWHGYRMTWMIISTNYHRLQRFN